MAGDTQITLVGNLVADPELRFTPSGSPVANFTVASTPRSFDRQMNEWKDGEALFLACSAWRQMAENVAESLTKGMRVIVQGRLRAHSFDDREGNKRTVFEIAVDEVGPALRYATAKVTRTASSGGNWQSSNTPSSNSPTASRPQPSNASSVANSQSASPQTNQGWTNGQQDDKQSAVSDPWASAQNDEPPF